MKATRLSVFVRSTLSLLTIVIITSCASYTQNVNPYLTAAQEEVATYKKVQLPLAQGLNYRVSQGAFGRWSHNEPGNEYFWDFDVPLGSLVRAAESGRVVDIWAPLPEEAGCESKYAYRAWNVQILHSDGSVAQYVHVHPLVQVGDTVNRGDIIAKTAWNGWICKPHLHFGVYASQDELYNSHRRKSIPIFFEGIDNGLAQEGMSGTAPVSK